MAIAFIVVTFIVIVNEVMTFRSDFQEQDPFNFSCKRWTCKHFNELKRNGTWKKNNAYYDQMGCACDSMCSFFNDCCEDYAPREENKMVENIRFMGLKAEDFSCIKNSPVSLADHILLVNKCPERNTTSTNDHFEELCTFNRSLYKGKELEPSHLTLPVTGQMSNVLYRNVYCALCHGEPHYSWSTEMVCNDLREPWINGRNVSLVEWLKKPWCQLYYRPPKKLAGAKNYRVCHPDAIDYCRYPKKVPKEVATRCTNGATPLRMVHRFYFSFKNPFCGMCFVGNMSFVQCAKYSGIYSTKGIWQAKGPYPFSILFDLTRGTVKTVVKENGVVQQAATLRCPQGTFFDPFSNVCRTVLCPNGTIYNGSDCVSNSNSTDLLTLNSTSQNEEKITCPRVELNHTEFDFNGTHLRLLKHDIVIPHSNSNLSKTDKGILVCSDDITTGSPTITTAGNSSHTIVIKFTPVESAISACGMSISVMALFLNAIYFIKMKQLRKTPNKCILSLTLSLLLANLFLLVSSFLSAYQILCKVMSILTHYFFLVVFLWMNVMAVDMWIVFSRLKYSLDKTSNRFRHYSIYAWVLPILIVVVAISLDTAIPQDSISPGYGSGLCWISSESSLTLFFAAPLALVLFVNLTLFLLTTRNLYRTEKASLGGKDTSSSRHGTKSTFIVYVKLTIIVGLTWILGFIMLIWDSPVTTYAFIVVNSLHGLFVFVTCICTRHFKRHVTSSFRSKDSKIKTSLKT